MQAAFAFGSCAQHLETGVKNRDKISMLCTKNVRIQAEYSGMISWIMGSMEKPCINHLNCSDVMERSSQELHGHEKRPHSTRLYRSKYPSPSLRSPLILVEDLLQKRNRVFGAKRFTLYMCSIMAAKESIP